MSCLWASSGTGCERPEADNLHRSYIQLTLKQFLVRIALVTFRGFRLLWRGIAAVGRVLLAPLGWFGRGLFRFALVPMYRVYTSLKQWLRLDPRFAGLRHFRHFLERYAVYVALIMCGTLTVGHSILARTIRPDEIGQGAVWSNFVQSETADLIVESGTPLPTKVATPHLAIGGAVAAAASDVISVDQDQGNTTGGPPTAVGVGSTGSVGSTVPIRHDITSYTVQGGDTVSSIATSFGVTNHTILWANGLGENDFIKPGQVLKIPPTSGYLYHVKAGDTIASITKKYGGTEQDTLDANDLPTADALQVGQDIVIPGGSPPAPPAPVIVPTRRGLLARLFTEPSGTPPPSAAATGARFIWPTPNHKINQYFRGRIHTGIDIEGDYSSPIYAAAAGTVIYASYDLSGYGLHIIVSHGNGYETLYGHASKIFVHVGDHVSQGQTIAMVGSTGRSTGTHLHFEVRTGGGFLNPLIFF